MVRQSGVRYCSRGIRHTRSSEELISEILILILVFLLPNIIIFTVYVRLIHKLWFSSDAKSSTNIGLLRSRRAVTKLFVTMTTLFVICWTPYTVDAILWFLDSQVSKLSEVLSLCFVFLYCAASALVYAVCNPTVRRAVQKACARGFACCHGKPEQRQVEPKKARAKTAQTTIALLGVAQQGGDRRPVDVIDME
ncbi:tachykinin-like peptides receptor 86C [Nematostella vectensis]|nr:tachykinin-like peptides receptor 86C [Nematostella vectensis]